MGKQNRKQEDLRSGERFMHVVPPDMRGEGGHSTVKYRTCDTSPAFLDWYRRSVRHITIPHVIEFISGLYLSGADGSCSLFELMFESLPAELRRGAFVVFGRDRPFRPLRALEERWADFSPLQTGIPLLCLLHSA